MEHHKIIIAGAGPTGMMLGCLLALRQVPFIILEKGVAVSTHSRSIGIHPPSIKIFRDIGLLDELLKAANKIETGAAFVQEKQVGVIHFSDLKTEYPFILTLSQSVTEQLLERKLQELAPDTLLRNSAIEIASIKPDSIIVKTTGGNEYKCDYLIGCDGKHSVVRQQAGILFRGHSYPDVYVMGDFEDKSGNRNQAEIHLSTDGLIESFPHGKNLRRWVVKTEHFVQDPAPEFISTQAKKRTGTAPDPETNSMISSFSTEQFMAETFVKNRIVLAGDSAHIVSPIGGQGMNLGWLDAAALADVLYQPDKEKLRVYNLKRRAKARIAARRAAFNMRMGRKFRSVIVRKFIVKTMLKQPFLSFFLKRFTMDGLGEVKQ